MDFTNFLEGKKVISSKWSYKIKYKYDGGVEISWLAVLECTKHYRDETFAIVLKMAIVDPCLLLLHRIIGS